MHRTRNEARGADIPGTPGVDVSWGIPLSSQRGASTTGSLTGLRLLLLLLCHGPPLCVRERPGGAAVTTATVSDELLVGSAAQVAEASLSEAGPPSITENDRRPPRAARMASNSTERRRCGITNLPASWPLLA